MTRESVSMCSVTARRTNSTASRKVNHSAMTHFRSGAPIRIPSVFLRSIASIVIPATAAAQHSHPVSHWAVRDPSLAPVYDEAARRLLGGGLHRVDRQVAAGVRFGCGEGEYQLSRHQSRDEPSA